jgi:hypothetical protein
VFPLFGNNNSDFLGGVIARTLLAGGRTATCSVQGSCMDGLSVDIHFSFIASRLSSLEFLTSACSQFSFFFETKLKENGTEQR